MHVAEKIIQTNICMSIYNEFIVIAERFITRAALRKNYAENDRIRNLKFKFAIVFWFEIETILTQRPLGTCVFDFFLNFEFLFPFLYYIFFCFILPVFFICIVLNDI